MSILNLISKLKRDGIEKQNIIKSFRKGLALFFLVGLGLGVGFAGGRVAQALSSGPLTDLPSPVVARSSSFLREAWDLLWKNEKSVIEIGIGSSTAVFNYNEFRNENLPDAKKIVEVTKEKVRRELAESDLAKIIDVSKIFKEDSCGFNATSSSGVDISINEIAWMGGAVDSASLNVSKEWLELKNKSSGTISLAGWNLQDYSGKFRIHFAESEISGGRYLVLSRDPNTHYSYKGQLVNSGMWLKLFDNDCLVVDEIDTRNGWPAGDNQTKQTMEWKEEGRGWQTSKDSGGTPGMRNSIILVAPPSDDLPDNEEETTPPTGGDDNNSTSSDEGDIPENYQTLLISEIQIAGVSNVHDEFAEIFNPNNAEVDLTGWYVQKATKSGNYSTFVPKSSFENKRIPGKGYLVIANPSGMYVGYIMTTNGLALDNSLVLKNPLGEVSDKVGWGEALDCDGICALPPSEGQSIQRLTMGDSFQDTGSNRNDFEIRACPSPAVKDSPCVPPADDPVEDPLPPTDDEIDNPPPTDEPNDPAPTSTTTTPTSTVYKVIISEVQISGGVGLTSQDFIKLYNSGTESVDISGWRLRKRTQSGSESSIKVLPNGSTILPGGSFIWANSADGFSESIGAQASSTQTLATNNSLGLQDSSSNLIDAVAWGEGHVSPFVEGGVFPTNPDGGQVLKRKTSGSGFQDTDDNASDLQL